MRFSVSKNNLQTEILLALIAVYLFWGGTYLAMKIAIDTIPPFLMGGLRFFTAGLLVYLWERRKGPMIIEKKQWLQAALVGALLLVFSMGGLVWAEQFVPTGTAAIIFATVPLWMSLFPWAILRQGRPAPLILFGLCLGFGGVVLLVSNSLTIATSSPIECLGYGIVTLAAIFWAWGSLYSRQADLPSSPLLSIALQNLTGGFCYIVISFCCGEWTLFSFQQLSPASLFSLLYLIFFGSLIGFGAYIWLLKVSDPALVSTYAYVNPVVALLLGWALAGEELTVSTITATIIILCSVLIIGRQENLT